MQGDVALANGRSLEPAGDKLTAELTRAPLEFTPDLDTHIDWELAFH